MLRVFDGRLTGHCLRRTYAGYAYYDQRLTCAGALPLEDLRRFASSTVDLLGFTCGGRTPATPTTTSDLLVRGIARLWRTFIPPLADFHPAFGGLSSRLWRTFIPPLADFHPGIARLSSRLWRAHALPWVFLLDVFLGLL